MCEYRKDSYKPRATTKSVYPRSPSTKGDGLWVRYLRRKYYRLPHLEHVRMSILHLLSEDMDLDDL